MGIQSPSNMAFSISSYKVLQGLNGRKFNQVIGQIFRRKLNFFTYCKTFNPIPGRGEGADCAHPQVALIITFVRDAAGRQNLATFPKI